MYVRERKQAFNNNANSVRTRESRMFVVPPSDVSMHAIVYARSSLATWDSDPLDRVNARLRVMTTLTSFVKLSVHLSHTLIYTDLLKEKKGGSMPLDLYPIDQSLRLTYSSECNKLFFNLFRPKSNFSGFINKIYQYGSNQFR
jgi:hypothetical protein